MFLKNFSQTCPCLPVDSNCTIYFLRRNPAHPSHESTQDLHAVENILLPHCSYYWRPSRFQAQVSPSIVVSVTSYFTINSRCTKTRIRSYIYVWFCGFYLLSSYLASASTHSALTLSFANISGGIITGFRTEKLI